MGTFLRCAAIAVAAGLLAAAPQPPPNADDRATLARASSPAVLIGACSRLIVAVGASTAIGAAAPRDAERDADAAALVAFLHSNHDVATRGRCARNFAMLANAHAIDTSQPRDAQEGHSAYGAEAVDAVIAMLHAPDAETRIAASKALYGLQPRSVGRALLHVAQTDTDSRVRAAAFRAMPWSMRMDVATAHDAAAYRNAIASALRTNDPVIVPGALVALAGLDGINADRTLRRFAHSPNATIRAGAIDAFDTMMAYNPSIVRFMESRLADPSPDVRDAVMLRLFRMGDHHAIPAIQRLAVSAPTEAERKSAADYARALKTQPDLSPTPH